MGAVEFSINLELARLLRDHLDLDVFVETGTFEGVAIQRVRPLFDEIHSIELSEAYFEQASARFAGDDAIRLYHGDSATTLMELAPALANRAVLYWLDAHWCVAEDAAGERSQCALLRELAALRRLNATSALLIDDARLFLAPPPHPHDASEWPSLQDVLDALRQLSDEHELMVLNDVIICYPRAIRPALSEHARRQGVDVLASAAKTSALAQELTAVRAAADERLGVIHELTRVAEERLAAIHQLTRVAEDRLAVIEELTDALEGLRNEEPQQPCGAVDERER